MLVGAFVIAAAIGAAVAGARVILLLELPRQYVAQQSYFPKNSKLKTLHSNSTVTAVATLVFAFRA